MTRKKADEDADCLLVNSALALAPTHPSVVVISEDIDLFVILIGISPLTTKIQVINSDEDDDDDEPIMPDDLVEASLSLHFEEDTDDLPKDIGP
ncbi:hypothetical protein AVEN_165122-1 [Araneus ventricosus]|uniref:Uncharacterized protein n=1 Tax=Araneus ventricosus TaxID=182803 RepID=A0A4Y2UF84_ARAVE|nr:hypothetical protein AVEN_165122-1 [Araneus ventricosus]